MTASLRSASLLMLFLTGCDQNPPLAVADVDLARFQGKWYEIAKLPRATETDCENTTATYRLVSDGKLAVQSECSANGEPHRMVAEAVVTDPKTPSKLSLNVAGFSGDYWILDVGKDYEYAVIGHPTRDYFWILSRAPTLDPSVTQGIVDRARADHFDVSRLEYTRQSTPNAAGAPAAGADVSPPEYGCALSASRMPNAFFPMALGAAGLAVAALGRRRRRH